MSISKLLELAKESGWMMNHPLGLVVHRTASGKWHAALISDDTQKISAIGITQTSGSADAALFDLEERITVFAKNKLESAKREVERYEGLIGGKR